MMICQNCKSENPGHAKYCHNCEEALNPASDLNQSETANCCEILNSKPKKTSSFIMIFVLSVLLIILLIWYLLFVVNGVKGTIITDNVPQENITIYLKSNDNDFSQTAQTDLKGQFNFTDVDPGKYSLIVTIPIKAKYPQFGNNLVLIKGVEVTKGKSVNQKLDINMYDTVYGGPYLFDGDWWVFFE